MKTKIVSLFLLTLFVFASCNLMGTLNETNQNTGDISVILPGTYSARDVVGDNSDNDNADSIPEKEDPDTVVYTLTLESNSNKEISEDNKTKSGKPGEKIIFEELEPGDYTIFCKYESNYYEFEGSTVVTVKENQTTAAVLRLAGGRIPITLQSRKAIYNDFGAYTYSFDFPIEDENDVKKGDIFKLSITGISDSNLYNAILNIVDNDYVQYNISEKNGAFCFEKDKEFSIEATVKVEEDLAGKELMLNLYYTPEEFDSILTLSNVRYKITKVEEEIPVLPLKDFRFFKNVWSTKELNPDNYYNYGLDLPGTTNLYQPKKGDYISVTLSGVSDHTINELAFSYGELKLEGWSRLNNINIHKEKIVKDEPFNITYEFLVTDDAELSSYKTKTYFSLMYEIKDLDENAIFKDLKVESKYIPAAEVDFKLVDAVDVQYNQHQFTVLTQDLGIQTLPNMLNKIHIKISGIPSIDVDKIEIHFYEYSGTEWIWHSLGFSINDQKFAKDEPFDVDLLIPISENYQGDETWEHGLLVDFDYDKAVYDISEHPECLKIKDYNLSVDVEDVVYEDPHFTFEPCDKGIKITLKRQANEEVWNSIRVEEKNTNILMIPVKDSENELVVYWPFVEKNKNYLFGLVGNISEKDTGNNWKTDILATYKYTGENSSYSIDLNELEKFRQVEAELLLDENSMPEIKLSNLDLKSFDNVFKGLSICEHHEYLELYQGENPENLNTWGSGSIIKDLDVNANNKAYSFIKDFEFSWNFENAFGLPYTRALVNIWPKYNGFENQYFQLGNANTNAVATPKATNFNAVMNNNNYMNYEHILLVGPVAASVLPAGTLMEFNISAAFTKPLVKDMKVSLFACTPKENNMVEYKELDYGELVTGYDFTNITAGTYTTIPLLIKLTRAFPKGYYPLLEIRYYDETDSYKQIKILNLKFDCKLKEKSNDPATDPSNDPTKDPNKEPIPEGNTDNNKWNNVSWKFTDKGIEFFVEQNKETGWYNTALIETKTGINFGNDNSWDGQSYNIVFPFVEKGKTYEFCLVGNKGQDWFDEAAKNVFSVTYTGNTITKYVENGDYDSFYTAIDEYNKNLKVKVNKQDGKHRLAVNSTLTSQKLVQLFNLNTDRLKEQNSTEMCGINLYVTNFDQNSGWCGNSNLFIFTNADNYETVSTNIIKDGCELSSIQDWNDVYNGINAKFTIDFSWQIKYDDFEGQHFNLKSAKSEMVDK